MFERLFESEHNSKKCVLMKWFIWCVAVVVAEVFVV